MRRLAAVSLVPLFLVACGQDGNPTTRGQQVYLAQCVICHNTDPAKDGPLGPPIKGSSPELLEARVLHGAYPPGYKPKRQSAVMQPMPHLAQAIPDLAAFLR